MVLLVSVPGPVRNCGMSKATHYKAHSPAGIRDYFSYFISIGGGGCRVLCAIGGRCLSKSGEHRVGLLKTSRIHAEWERRDAKHRALHRPDL